MGSREPADLTREPRTASSSPEGVDETGGAGRSFGGLMDNLVLCPCGHSLAQHDYAGCSGDRLRSCNCLRDRHAALEAAVDSVRTTPVYNSAYASRGNDAA